MKKKYLIGIIIIFSIILTIVFLELFKTLNEQDKTNVKYSQKVIDVIKKSDKYTEIINKQYSKTLEEVIIENQYNEDYLNDYLKIVYQDESNFANNINELLMKGYSSEQINNIYLNYFVFLNDLVNYDNMIDLNFLEIDGFFVKNYNRYNEYLKNNEYSLEEAIRYVNINLDIPFYEKYDDVIDPNSLTVLVNKYNKLDENYVPNNLVSLNNGMKVREEIKQPLEQMVSDARNDNVSFGFYSAYRSYERQSVLYNNYSKRDGQTLADTYSARPGFSEHQTGLAVDLSKSTGGAVKKNSVEYNWLDNNAHKYGFIIRFPLGKEFITGYQFEPWHIRYIGVEHASRIKELNITYDEYYSLYLKEV